MNTLRKLQKSIENVEAELDKCFIVDGTEDISTLIRKLERIEVIHSEIESGMKAEFNKITEKMDQRDPITNEARFGPSTKEKIISFGNSFLILEDRIKVIHLKIVNCINELPPVKDTPESADDEVIYLQQLTTDEEIEKKQLLEQQIQAETEQENHIREKARILREKKATELKQSALLLQALTETLQLYISELNTLLSCTDADMEMRIQTFTQSLLCAGKIRECEDALKTIADILERIIRRPDDAPGRRLRVTHPVLQSKLTGISGGIELLISCGFQAIALIAEHVATNNAAPSASSSVSDKLQLDLDHFASSAGSAVERGLFAMLHPHSEWTLTLVMEEPQIDALLPPAPTAALALNPSESSKLAASIPAKLDWISWFDGLERNLKLFKRTIATIQ